MRALIRRLLLVTALLLAIAGLFGAIFWMQVIPALDRDVATLVSHRPATLCTILDRHGAVIDRLHRERRVWVPIDELPETLINAMLAAEDRRFLDHPGVDLWGVLRALVQNTLAGHVVEGGSTITQQLVKNVVTGSERSLQRKVREALLSWRLEQRMSKARILELYLNYIYLGSGNYGVEAAAQDYFGISARAVDPGQAALIAGLIPSPNLYSPRHNRELAAQARRRVLKAMVEEGYLGSWLAGGYTHQAIPLPPREGVDPGYAAAYRTAARREIERLLGPDVPLEEGLRIHTGLDPDILAIAEGAIASATQAVEARQGHGGPQRHLDGEEAIEAFLSAAPGLLRDPVTQEPIPPEPGACIEAVFVGWREGFEIGPHRLRIGRRTWATPIRSGLPRTPPRSLQRSATPGDVYAFCLDGKGVADLAPHPWVEGAAVVMEIETSAVRATVGGRETTLMGFDRSTQALRQPGSSFKPFVYGANLVAGESQLSRVLDGPVTVETPGRPLWSPQNAGKGYSGWLTLRQALAKSANTAAVRLGLAQGTRAIIDLAGALGVASELRDEPTLFLGSSEVTVLDMATAYTTLARMGLRSGPVFIEAISQDRGGAATAPPRRGADGLVEAAEEGASGETAVILARAGDAIPFAAAPERRLPGGEGDRVIPPGVAWELIDMMRGVVLNGTGRRAQDPLQDRAGKTGTNSDYVDAWFVGMTPRHVIAVWIGVDDNTSLGPKEEGGRAALPAFAEIASALATGEEERFHPPAGVLPIWYGGEQVFVNTATAPRSAVYTHPPGRSPLPDFPSGR